MFMARLFAVVALLALLAPGAAAEVFVLAGGGRIEGELLNRDESPRRRYVVRVAGGATMTIDAAQVKKKLPSRPEEAEYERIRPTYADTAAAQWELAQWCRQHKLSAEREVHLRRVVELDPEHREARHALGYSRLDGRWTTQEEVMIKRGYVRYKGQWKTPQEVELDKNKEALKAVQQEWFQKLKRWRGWLGSKRDEEARHNIRTIADPAAAKALAMGLRDDADPQVRLLLVEALAKIDTSDAALALAERSLFDPAEEVRLTCLDHLQTKRRPAVIAYYVAKLKDKKSNEVVNLAGLALGRMKDPAAIGPLIDALVTVHKFKINNPGGDNATSAGFGSGGGGLAVGKRPSFVSRSLENRAVLEALVVITGKNFNFDKQAWKRWYADQQKAPDGIDARRG
jgi:hypothetical protein